MFHCLKAYSNHSDTKAATAAVIDKIQQPNANLVLFFASSKYDFTLVSALMKEAFPNTEVIGCTSNGELGAGGFTQGYLLAASIRSDDFIPSVVVVKDIRKRAMAAKQDILAAFEKTGLRLTDLDLEKKGFAITLIDGLVCGEEKVMSVLSAIFKDKAFPIVGGSAGDADFKQTYVSANGEVFENAAVIAFVKTNKPLFLYKENIYEPTSIEFKATKVDIENRIVYEFNHRPAVDFYAEILGIPKHQFTEAAFSSHPLGKVYGKNIWICSPYLIQADGSIKFYAQIMTDSVLKLLKPMDPIEEARKTAQQIKTHVKNPKCILAFNCVLRYQQFSRENSLRNVYDALSGAGGEIVGFTTFGEQYLTQHVNQTLTLIAIGESNERV